MDWINCFSNKRYGIPNQDGSIRTAYERDWDRIIFSSPFRRLQNKTQVFPLPEEVFVHNRLTHSLEVASVGRSLGKLVGKKIALFDEVNSNSEVKNFYRNHLKNVIAAACLAHDLGNPAFGHSGEEAISKYFNDKANDSNFRKLFSDRQWSDLTHFEGNANTIRILTKKVNGKDNGSFRLTYSTLGAIIKYPCESSATLKSQLHRKKYGYFQIDESVFLDIVTELKMISDKDSTGKIIYKRHPFVFLVEAADDICYNIIDLEDAHRLGILDYELVKRLLSSLIELNQSENVPQFKINLKEVESDKNEAVAYLRAKAINYLAIRCADIFITNKDDILKGTLNNDLLNLIPEAQSIIKEIKSVSIKQIYNSTSVVKIELAGFRIMSGLIEDFVEAAILTEEKRQNRHKKVLSLLPNQFQFQEDADAYTKVMHIIDFVSGMTDLFALKLYKNLRGIEMPSI